MSRKTLAASLVALAAASLAAFEISPIIFPADTEATVTVRAENNAEKKILAEQPLHYISSQALWSDGTHHGTSRWSSQWEKLEPVREDGRLSFKVRLRGEGWHLLRFGTPTGKDGVFTSNKYPEFMIYSLKPDLFKLRPWKGDIHQHSVRCGHAKIEPRIIPAYNRLVGFDFMALSEHWLHAPSVEAIEAAKPWKCGMELFTGEEFHSHGAILHSVAVGHRAGINDWMQANQKEFQRRVAEELKKPIYDRYEFDTDMRLMAARAMVLYQVGRELGAKVLVYSHPTDMNPIHKAEAPPECFRTFMLDNADYDALELPNVATESFNPATRRADRIMLMNALAMEQLERGRRPAFVAASDNHNQAAYLGIVYTVFFAEKCNIDEFAAAVKARRTLGLRSVGTPSYLIFGPSRLMKFQQFLELHYWPGHDKLCRKQGELLLRLAEHGDTTVLPEVERLAKEIDAYRERCYGTVK